jgi:hypothetical protein
MLALIPALLQAAPFLANLIFGDKTGDVVAKAAGIAGQVLGVDGASPDAVTAALAKADPKALAELQTKLAQFAHEETMAKLAAEQADRQREHDEMLARIEDVSSARAQTTDLAKLGSAIAWGAPLVSVVVLATFFWVLEIVLSQKIPQGQENLVYIMLGALTTMATGVVGYWVGSTAGSSHKNEMLARMIPPGK